ASAVPGGPAALSRFRLVAFAGTGDQGVKLFERVAGAELRGAAAAGARVRLGALIQALDGPRVSWVGEAVADPYGRFVLRVPYATEPNPGSAHAIAMEL